MTTTRQDVLTLSRDFFKGQKLPETIPGNTYIPPSGKVVEADDLI